jgi:hypothetical protein
MHPAAAGWLAGCQRVYQRTSMQYRAQHCADAALLLCVGVTDNWGVDTQFIQAWIQAHMDATRGMGKVGGQGRA